MENGYKNQPECVIRFCCRDERQDAIRLIRLVWSRLDCKDWFAVNDTGYLEELMQRDDIWMWGAFSGKEMLAILVVVVPDKKERYLDSFLPDDINPVAYLDIVAVHPSSRGQHLQQRLMRHAELFLVRRSIAYLQATVHPMNIYSLQNLMKEGFEILAETYLYGNKPRYVLGKYLHATHSGKPCVL